MKSYELVVLGSGPAGVRGAMTAAALGHSVAIVERQEKAGGADWLGGTLPSQILKETALFLSGALESGPANTPRIPDPDALLAAFLKQKTEVLRREQAALEQSLELHGIEVYRGQAKLLDAHTVKIEGWNETQIQAEKILVATGSRAVHPPELSIDGFRVHDTESFLAPKRFPQSLIILGSNPAGCEFATIFRTFGIPVTILDERGEDHFFPYLDGELRQAFRSRLEKQGVAMKFQAKVKRIEAPKSEKLPVDVFLENGEILGADMVLVCLGRRSQLDGFDLEKAGLKTDAKGHLELDPFGRGTEPHLAVAGNARGIAVSASQAKIQARRSVQALFGIAPKGTEGQYPSAYYTVPEMAFAGLTEAQAKARGETISVTLGFSHCARGRIGGFKDGFFKIIAAKDTGKIAGVHIMGPGASELVHWGHGAIETGRTLEELADEVFNTPTLHELYRMAANEALVRMRRGL